ncbi:polysaccharide deacetylase family protein [Gemmatimonas sp. UBA7669]|uniref:polysaccharide deacetylase family protein n=1 Tax=Gemmatimonas sp. UBA7669 TaxID=1946568 RepID=UPI0039C878A6
MRVPNSGSFILAYHGVQEGRESEGERGLHISHESLHNQLSTVGRHFDVVSLEEVLRVSDTRSARVAITFDDAYLGALTLGASVCETLGYPFTVFVAPGLLGTIPVWDERSSKGQWTISHRQTFLWDQKGRARHRLATSSSLCLPQIGTESDLLALRGSKYATFGNHTYSHPNLRSLSDDEVSLEISKGRAWLETRFPTQFLNVVAYPYGLAPRNAERLMAEPHAAAGLLVHGGWFRRGNVPTFAVPRWNVPSAVGRDRFLAKLRGWL